MEAIEWLVSREPRPPAALSGRMKRAVAEISSSETASVSSRLLAAAVAILSRGDSSAVSGRALAALDLLAADALITYAMEAASDDCESIASVADSAVRMICAVEGRVA